MHESRNNNSRDCVIMHEPKVSVLSVIETIIGQVALKGGM